MVDSKYIVEIKKFLTENIRRMSKTGSDISEGHFVDKARDYLTKINGSPSRETGMMCRLRGCTNDSSHTERIWDKIQPDVERYVADTVRQCRSRQMVTEIRQVTAQAIISQAMDEAGLKYHVLPQTHRAKVSVRLGQKNKAVFYISYRNTQEDLDRCIPAAKALIGLMGSLGKTASIQKLMAYENW